MGIRSKYVYPPGSTDQLDTGWGPQDSQVGLQVAEFYVYGRYITTYR